MRYTCLILVYLTISLQALCQGNDIKDIYSESLYWHLQNLKSVGALKEQTVYIEEDLTSTANLTQEIDFVRVVSLSRSQIRHRTRGGDGINLIAIKPVSVELRTLKVVLIDFYVTSRGKKFNYANGGGSTVEFKYNCVTKQFEYADNYYRGI